MTTARRKIMPKPSRRFLAGKMPNPIRSMPWRRRFVERGLQRLQGMLLIGFGIFPAKNRRDGFGIIFRRAVVMAAIGNLGLRQLYPCTPVGIAAQLSNRGRVDFF